MKIINLISFEFEEASLILKEKVISDFKPDVVVGIATGGAIVVGKMGFTGVSYLEIKRQRPFTKIKNGLNLSFILPRLPVFVNNFLRIIELWLNERKFERKGFGSSKSNVILTKGNLEVLKECKNILIVDDAVDSGGTLIECVNYIKSLSQENTVIKTAVINTTFKNPALTPDYVLYVRTIVRYPWANDVKLK